MLLMVGFLILVVIIQTFYLLRVAQEADRYRKAMETEDTVKGRLDKIFENQADVQASLRKELEEEYTVKIARLESKLREAKGLPSDGKISGALKPKGSLKKAAK